MIMIYRASGREPCSIHVSIHTYFDCRLFLYVHEVYELPRDQLETSFTKESGPGN